LRNDRHVNPAFLDIQSAADPHPHLERPVDRQAGEQQVLPDSGVTAVISPDPCARWSGQALHHALDSPHGGPSAFGAQACGVHSAERIGDELVRSGRSFGRTKGEAQGCGIWIALPCLVDRVDPTGAAVHLCLLGQPIAQGERDSPRGENVDVSKAADCVDDRFDIDVRPGLACRGRDDDDWLGPLGIEQMLSQDPLPVRRVDDGRRRCLAPHLGLCAHGAPPCPPPATCSVAFVRLEGTTDSVSGSRESLSMAMKKSVDSSARRNTNCQ
jgi:hypothetical protein